MNRAWIPAGALAGVSVAGLIALGSLSDSLGTPVTFESSVALPAVSASHTSKPVSLKVDFGNTGATKTASAALDTHGGQASATDAPVSGESGQAGYRKFTPSSSSSHSSATQTPTTQKPVKRKTLIGADTGPNGDTGLAADGSGGSPSVGGQRATLGSDTP
jgi:hypothetical protein